MKARLKFNKYGSMKFIGHLDIMRYFQKAFRRAGIDIAYSQGFNPHQLTSFASPLGVGLTSDGEYMDMQLNSDITEEEFLSKINETMAEGISVISFKPLKDDCIKSMAAVAAADYMVSLKDGYDVIDNFAEKFNLFIGQSEIVITKKTKKSEVEMDIKPLIFHYGLDDKEFAARTNGSYDISFADAYSNDNVVFLQLSSGSVANLKPELVMEAFYNFIGAEMKPFAFQIHRLEMYANDVTKEEAEQGVRNLVPLENFEVR
ncbi:MAG: TIGR03936 family radical SAM-associated protein [bacterium]|nr:TIGR03936 family radical SAM-associated protein [bacterium]